MDYLDVRKRIKPFDLIFFHGGEAVSRVIRIVSRLNTGVKCDWSHVGVVITSEVLDHPLVKPGQLYIWESTMGGVLADGIRDIGNKQFFGVQLRNLTQVLAAQLSDSNVKVGWARLEKKYRPKVNQAFKDDFTEFFYRQNHSRYNINLISVLSSLIKPLRKIHFPRLENKSWKICSEHVVDVLIHVGIYPHYIEKVNSKYVIPIDIVNPGQDNEEIKLPKRFRKIKELVL